jgi:methenyltetrahydrofolate cyclohydrolase
VLDALRLPPERPDRSTLVAEAFARATEVPFAVTETARRVADLGAHLVAEGNPNLRGDAVTAVLLADAAGRCAAHLVELNVRHGALEGDWRERSAVACAALADAVRAVEALG